MNKQSWYRGTKQFLLFEGEGDGSHTLMTPVGDKLAVEDTPGGTIFVVDAYTGCTCTGSRTGGMCRHERLAYDVWTRSKTGLRYIVKSALHKEIRRGDTVQALLWARWCAHYHGNSWLKSYVKRLLLEEGRCVELCKNWQSLTRISWIDVVAQAAAMSKKWELLSRAGIFTEYVAAFVTSEHQSVLAGVKEISEASKGCSSRFDLFTLFWRAQRSHNTQASSWLIEALSPFAREQGGIAQEWVEQGLWRTTPFYGPKVLIEMLTGAWSQEANLIDSERVTMRPVPGQGIPLLPAVPIYAYDCHDTKGRQKLIGAWAHIAQEQPMPAGLDLRWSGMLAGVCWREFAARQFPRDYVQRRWEEVRIDQNTWHSAMACDRYFYVSFYERLDNAFQSQGHHTSSGLTEE